MMLFFFVSGTFKDTLILKIPTTKGGSIGGAIAWIHPALIPALFSSCTERAWLPNTILDWFKGRGAGEEWAGKRETERSDNCRDLKGMKTVIGNAWDGHRGSPPIFLCQRWGAGLQPSQSQSLAAVGVAATQFLCWWQDTGLQPSQSQHPATVTLNFNCQIKSKTL